MARGKQVHLRVSGNNPESIEVTLEGLDGSALVEIPYADGLVFADGEDEVLVRMEQTSGGVLEVASASVDFPCLGIYINELANTKCPWTDLLA
jgi:hypothetical protein